MVGAVTAKFFVSATSVLTGVVDVTTTEEGAAVVFSPNTFNNTALVLTPTEPYLVVAFSSGVAIL